MTKKTPIDVLQDASMSQRLGAKVKDALEELDVDRLREIGEAITEAANSAETIGTWREGPAEEPPSNVINDAFTALLRDLKKANDDLTAALKTTVES